MIKDTLLTEATARIRDVFSASPARDVEKNLKSAIAGWLGRLDVVTREEFDAQAQVLARTREKLAELETRIAKLEGNESAN